VPEARTRGARFLPTELAVGYSRRNDAADKVEHEGVERSVQIAPADQVQRLHKPWIGDAASWPLLISSGKSP
jgi:hypothetical protein